MLTDLVVYKKKPSLGVPVLVLRDTTSALKVLKQVRWKLQEQTKETIFGLADELLSR